MPLETPPALSRARASASADIAALAAHLRRSLEHAARGDPSGAGSLERRLLRRLFGALSAFEAASGILGPEPAGAAGGEGAPLIRQACPSCGRSEFEVVSGLWAVHFVCRHCGVCSRPERHSLTPTDPETCPGCGFADRCANRTGQQAPTAGSLGGAVGDLRL